MDGIDRVHRGEEKVDLSLSWEQMDELRGFLADEFGICQMKGGTDVFSSIRATCGDRIADEYEQLNAIRAGGTGREYEAAEKRFWDLISEDPLLGMVHSQKWPFIFDAAALVTALGRGMPADAFVLDVGCHGGYHALWLAKVLGCQVKGIDACRPAVRYARGKGKAHGLTPRPLSYDAMDFPREKPRETASLLLCIDGPLGIDSQAFTAAASVLCDDGRFVWIGGANGLEAAELRAALDGTGLTLELADVLGGWDGLAYGANLVLVMRRGANAQVPDDVMAQAQSIWEEAFKHYANAPGRLPEEKTIGHFRTMVKYGPRH